MELLDSHFLQFNYSNAAVIFPKNYPIINFINSTDFHMKFRKKVKIHRVGFGKVFIHNA